MTLQIFKFAALICLILGSCLGIASNAECDSLLAFTADSNLYITDLCQDTYTQLTSDNASYRPAISPDGTMVVVESSGHIDVMNVDGTNRHTISGNILYPHFPAWSPDGQYVSFSSHQVYLVRPDGSDLHQLVSTNGNATALAWSPDGEMIAFVAHFSESQHAIYAVTIANLDVQEILLPVGHYPDNFISWSPDGQQVAYVVQDSIHVLAVSTLSTSVLTATGDNLGNPTWSPDGSYVIFEGTAFRSSRSDTIYPFQIFSMDVETNEIVPLTEENDSRWPMWSPDGQQIAFVSYRGEGNWSIYTMAADGSNQTRIVQPDNTENINPVWRS